MFFTKKNEFYGSHLENAIAQVKEGAISYLPQIFCVFAESSQKHKKTASNFLSEILNHISISTIYKIDAQMRDTTSIEWSIHWRTYHIQDFMTKQMSEAEKRAVLIFASFHPNGYIREQAIQALAKYQNTLPYLLLRCNDWVIPVRQTALNLLPSVCTKASHAEILFALPIMKKLQRSERCDYTAIFSIVLQIFQNNPMLLQQGLESEDVRTRRFCISLLNHVKDIDSAYLTNYIVKEKDPFLRKILFQTMPQNVNRLMISKQFLHDKYPPNRILALQYFAEHHIEGTLEIAIQMLLDKNARVRAAARDIVLCHAPHFDIRQMYLEQLNSHTAICILGLGEVGQIEDCNAITPFLCNPRISVSCAAMIALMRLDAETYVSCITNLLQSEHRKIVKTATLLLKKNRLYDCETIFAIQNQTSYEYTKIKCATLLFLCGKWKSLIYALAMLGHGYENLDTCCLNKIHQWILHYNRSYAVLSELEKQKILTLLHDKQNFLSTGLIQHILFLVK